jgi:hypothetical protein
MIGEDLSAATWELGEEAARSSRSVEGRQGMAVRGAIGWRREQYRCSDEMKNPQCSSPGDKLPVHLRESGGREPLSINAWDGPGGADS